MTFSDKQDCIKIKDQGRLLLDPKAGGSYAVFSERPPLETAKVLHSKCVPSTWPLEAILRKVINQDVGGRT